ncbi:unnamed protein product [Clonostachys rosea]|uniref:NACHT domain-containing protein n=1 Tax=Bionectria ochroleuca TaxID=29856 RepID=A0ABY6U6Z7_BIOOC|nr:unnamed protein product [Clonostachys rosea]
MEALGLAANIVAVVDISFKVVGWCAQYAQDVKSAKDDKIRLSREVSRLNLVLQNARDLINSPQGARLVGSKSLLSATADSEGRLRQLDVFFASQQKTRGSGIFTGSSALKWPFQSKEVTKIALELQRCCEAITSALEIDQTGLLLELNQKLAFEQLPFAEGANFDSHAEEHGRTCLSHTRVELLDDISSWIDRKEGKTIFWLNGMAGTGKSTIARTVCHSQSKSGHLGASFFFKRGETDRESLKKFFPTLARQLAANFPPLSPYIRASFDADPGLLGKTVKEQFYGLILEPLSRMPKAPGHFMPLVFIIDALDECDSEDISLLIELLSSAKSSKYPALRILLTSRPELPIRLGFMATPDMVYEDLVLHEITRSIIEHDIFTFLSHEFNNIRNTFNMSVTEGRKLPLSWPSDPELQILTKLSVPLFIFAATICRFVGDRRYGNPKKILEQILDHADDEYSSKLAKTYLPVLQQQLSGVSERRKGQILVEFVQVVGTIIVLASPLSVPTLARLLDISTDRIHDRLDMLHSVLHIPSSPKDPVRMLHLSFRDYLVDTSNKTDFWVDERATHEHLARRCLIIMKHGLRKNPCNIHSPGTHRRSINPDAIEAALPPELQYSCLHWMHHTAKTISTVEDTEVILQFMKSQLLYWLEAMAIIGRGSECLGILRSLQDWLSNRESSCSTFVADAVRFVLKNLTILETAPLQVYSSALLFAPINSLVRKTFEDHIPDWITHKPKLEDQWDACILTLEGHDKFVTSAVFSSDCKLIASGSRDATVRLWSVETGKCIRIFKGHKSGVTTVSFSHGSKYVASGSDDATVRVWSVGSGKCRVLEGHTRSVGTVIFSHDSKLLLSTSYDFSARVWDLSTDQHQILGDRTSRIASAEFSSDSSWVVLTSDNWETRVWNLKTKGLELLITASGAARFSRDATLLATASDTDLSVWSTKDFQCQWSLKGHQLSIRDISFSHDSRLLVSSSEDYSIRVWDVETKQCAKVLDNSKHRAHFVTFLSSSDKVLSYSKHTGVWLWDIETKKCGHVLQGRGRALNSVNISSDFQLLASYTTDDMVRIWDLTGVRENDGDDTHQDLITILKPSKNLEWIASVAGDPSIKIWDPVTGECIHTLKGHDLPLHTIAFSANSKFLVSASYDSIRIWVLKTGECTTVIRDYERLICQLAFSEDCTMIATAAGDNTCRIWEADTGACQMILAGHLTKVISVAFSHDAKFIATGSEDCELRIWDLQTGNCVLAVTDHNDSVFSVKFSKDSSKLISCSSDGVIKLWRVQTWSCEGTLISAERNPWDVAISDNAGRVVSALRRGSVEVWDTKTGLRIGTLDFESRVDWVSFEPNDLNQILTNAGRIAMMPSASTMDMLVAPTLGISHDISWITYCGKKMLWLPTECRRGKTFIHGPSIMIGGTSGGVIHLTVSEPRLNLLASESNEKPLNQL